MAHDGLTWKLGHWELMQVNIALGEIEHKGRLEEIFLNRPGEYTVTWTPYEVDPECERCGGANGALIPLINGALICNACMDGAIEEIGRKHR